jgi:hypothetical protein
MNAGSRGLGPRNAWRGNDDSEARAEDVLLAWLLWLPAGTDAVEAAVEELRRPAFRHPTDRRLTRLAELLRDVAAARPQVRS